MVAGSRDPVTKITFEPTVSWIAIAASTPSF
jgi:hypothetical protein